MKFSNLEILNYLNEIDNHLKTSKRIKFEYTLDWANRNFKDRPAIYALFDDEDLAYIGETSSLLKRMKDIRRTYNHTFRKQRGKKLFETNVNKKGVFSEEEEVRLTAYFERNIKMTFYYIAFGRSEAESYLIHKNKGEDSDLLYNKVGKRDLALVKSIKEHKDY
ncbi:hypothetical protein [Tenacibaculum maritimum]|uniref:hypothetical protein n=1 Tax=Tenacibaculum maritimum TaxID=107401 RepID=UPI00388EFF0E